jgi:glyoxylase-like metal-dependent hydrolase (beta-lactamase superfamily II)
MKHLLLASSAFLLFACGADTSSDISKAASDIKSAAKESVANTIVAIDRELPAPADDLRTESLGNNLYVIFGPGGNVGVSVGDDGVLLIDDKFARNAEGILTQVRGLTDAPLKYVLNTHYHGDHTGSNAQMAAAGAELVAHVNVRKRLGMTFENKLFGRTTEAVDESLWPTTTYDGVTDMMFNGHTVSLIHTPSAHTDGDSLVHFKEANTVHMGDNYFNGLFPYIDVDAGGSVLGMIAAHNKVLAMADENTVIIPGHGPIASKADLTAARDMLQNIHDRVKSRIDAGDSLETILDSNILQDYEKYASFISEANMVRIAHRSIIGE